MDGHSTIRITESSNPLTQNIDTAKPIDIVKQISNCDLEIFEGWKDHENIFSDRILQALEDAIGKAAQVIQNPERSCVVISGCGTSGRLAFYVSRDVNRFLRQEADLSECCQYLIAGGDIALLRSTEAQEDDPNLGSAVLDQLCADKDHVLYIGITCGLSAAYVAGQIDLCLNQLDKYFPVLIGFNPLSQARNNNIEKWSHTCASVFKRLEEAQDLQKAAILNPVIGPEPITGSSRMKGGTATKVLLDVLFQVSIHRVMSCQTTDGSYDSKSAAQNLLNMYRDVFRQIPSCQDHVALVITAAGKSLNSNGHLYYLGADQFGMLGIIDASECPPTYGSDFKDVRGFLQGGFSSWGNKEGHLGDKNDISLKAFIKHNLPHLTENDTVILINIDPRDGPSDLHELHQLWDLVEKSPAYTVCLELNQSQSQVISEGKSLHLALNIPWDHLKNYIKRFLPESLMKQIKANVFQISVKQTLNMISTGAHILKGKVYHNYMIDLKLSNNKLFHRGISIITELSKVPKDVAWNAILKSVYRIDALTADQRQAGISQHISRASTVPKVLPVTMLLIEMENCTVEMALQTLNEYPVIRTAFETLSKQ